MQHGAVKDSTVDVKLIVRLVLGRDVKQLTNISANSGTNWDAELVALLNGEFDHEAALV